MLRGLLRLVVEQNVQPSENLPGRRRMSTVRPGSLFISKEDALMRLSADGGMTISDAISRQSRSSDLSVCTTSIWSRFYIILPRTDPLNSHEHMLHTCMGLLRTYVAFLLPGTVRAEAIATLP